MWFQEGTLISGGSILGDIEREADQKEGVDLLILVVCVLSDWLQIYEYHVELCLLVCIGSQRLFV